MSASSKPRASDSEILFLITIRRQTAWESMRNIVEGFGTPPHHIPSVTLLSNYFMNMVFCIELMLKLLSRNWTSHDVGSMYQAVFGNSHPSSQLLQDVRSAIVDQKYLFEPVSGLSGSVPELESLYDEILIKLKGRFPDFSIASTVTLPNSFTEYIRDHAARFCRLQSSTFDASNLPPANFGEAHVADSHRQLQQVRQSFADHAGKHSVFEFFTRINSLT